MDRGEKPGGRLATGGARAWGARLTLQLVVEVCAQRLVGACGRVKADHERRRVRLSIRIGVWEGRGRSAVGGQLGFCARRAGAADTAPETGRGEPPPPQGRRASEPGAGVRCIRVTYPWLGGVVPDVPDLHACLLPQLALDRVFERLAGLDEP